MNTNELTYNAIAAGDIIPNDWCSIDLEGYTDYELDKEVCFKLSVWNLQCKFSKKVLEYINKLSYGIVSDCLLEDLLEFKYGLEVLNRYNPKLFGTEDGEELNSISYDTIVNILNKLSLKYK